MKSFFNNDLMKLSAGIGLIVLSIGCGKETPPAPAPAPVTPAPTQPTVSNACAADQFRVNGACVTCASLGGALVTVSGKQLCRKNMNYVQNGYYERGGSISLFPVLNEMYPANPGALVAPPLTASSGIPLVQGDKVTLAAAGAWGSTSVDVNRYLGGIITTTTWSTNCSEVDLSGKKGGTQLVYPEGSSVAAGLMASDGTKVYSLATQRTFTAENNGYLYVGFNLPSDITGPCGYYRLTSIQIMRCIDQAGATQACQ